VGIHLADIVQEAQEPTATQLWAESLPDLSSRLQGLAATAVKQLQTQGFDEKHIAVENFLNLRWVGGNNREMRPSVLQSQLSPNTCKQYKQLGPLGHVLAS
jgi:5-oxoprolinase (ATP-hydrolysing)